MARFAVKRPNVNPVDVATYTVRVRTVQQTRCRFRAFLSSDNVGYNAMKTNALNQQTE